MTAKARQASAAVHSQLQAAPTAEHEVPYSTWNAYALSALIRTRRAPAETILVEGMIGSLCVVAGKTGKRNLKNA